MRYRSKPAEVEAVLWTGDINDLPADWIAEGHLELDGDALNIGTLEGPTRATPGEHFVVRGTVGEFYPVRRDIFEAKYEAVE